MVCTSDICPRCTECTNCHKSDLYDLSAKCRVKYARRCSHWRRSRKAFHRARKKVKQDTVNRDDYHDEPLTEEKPICYDDPLNEECHNDSYMSHAKTALVPVHVGAFSRQQSPQAPQFGQQASDAQFHPTRPPHQLYADPYLPSGDLQHPLVHQTQHTYYQALPVPQHPPFLAEPVPSMHPPGIAQYQRPFYQVPPVPQHPPYLVNPSPSMHPPMQTSWTWTQQPMPPVQWQYSPHPSYLSHQPPTPQPQQIFDAPRKSQLTSYMPIKRTSNAGQHAPIKQGQLRTLAPKLLTSQEQPQGTLYKASAQLDQRVQAAHDAEVVTQTQPVQNCIPYPGRALVSGGFTEVWPGRVPKMPGYAIQASRRAARNQLQQNVQAAQAALNRSRTTVEQQDQQTAGHQKPRLAAELSACILPTDEPQATTPGQQIQTHKHPISSPPRPRHHPFEASPALTPQTEAGPKSLPLGRTSIVPDSQPTLSPSHADQDRDTLEISISADQHEIRAAYWKREFECHPARHRDSTSALQAAMAEKLVKAQEAADRLGGFVGMSWGLWEGLDEYSNNYDLIARDGRSEK